MIDHDEKLKMCHRMRAYGGSFMRALAEAIILADGRNLEKLLLTFPEVVEKYGPNSPFKLHMDGE